VASDRRLVVDSRLRGDALAGRRGATIGGSLSSPVGAGRSTPSRSRRLTGAWRHTSSTTSPGACTSSWPTARNWKPARARRSRSPRATTP